MKQLTLNPNIAVVITAILPYSGFGVCKALETHAHKYEHLTRWTLGKGTIQQLECGEVVDSLDMEEGDTVLVPAGRRHRLKPRTEQWAYQCEHWDHDVLDVEVYSSMAAV